MPAPSDSAVNRYVDAWARDSRAAIAAQPQVEVRRERPGGDRGEVGLQVDAIDLGRQVRRQRRGVGGAPVRSATVHGGSAPTAVDEAPALGDAPQARRARGPLGIERVRARPARRADGSRPRRCAAPPAAPRGSPRRSSSTARRGVASSQRSPSSVTTHSRSSGRARSRCGRGLDQVFELFRRCRRRAGLGEALAVGRADRAGAGARRAGCAGRRGARRRAHPTVVNARSAAAAASESSRRRAGRSGRVGDDRVGTSAIMPRRRVPRPRRTGAVSP